MIPFLDFRKEKGANRYRTFFILLLFTVSGLFFLLFTAAPKKTASPAASIGSMDRADDSLILQTVIFAGDGGAPNEPAFALLERDAALVPQTEIVFLGDNIYPAGLPPPGTAGYPSAAKALDRQIMVAAASKANVHLVPGNHDWDHSGPAGLAAVRRQSEYLNSKLGPTGLVPGQGCPGPVEAFQNRFFRALAIDSEWYLRNLEKPSRPEDGCPYYTEEGMLAAASAAVVPLSGQPGQQVIFMTHHPLQSDGSHAFSSRCFQDAECPKYKEMKQRLFEAFAGNPPLICAAGHDHALQIIQGRPGCKYYVVSGTMSNSHGVKQRDGSLYASNEPGFIRLDRHASGRLILSVKTVSGSQDGKPVFSVEIKP